jgi:hypothetical protein
MNWLLKTRFLVAGRAWCIQVYLGHCITPSTTDFYPRIHRWECVSRRAVGPRWSPPQHSFWGDVSCGMWREENAGYSAWLDEGLLESCRIPVGHVPVQTTPFPLNPVLQAQVNAPFVFVQRAFILSQLWVFVVHSFISGRRQCEITLVSIIHYVRNGKRHTD